MANTIYWAALIAAEGERKLKRPNATQVLISRRWLQHLIDDLDEQHPEAIERARRLIKEVT